MAQLDLSPLFSALADVLASGQEEIATIGAAALRRHAGSSPVSEPAVLDTNTAIENLLHDPNGLPCTTQILPVLDQLSWHYSGYDDGRISADVALKMQTVELIGALGMIFDDSCRVGLFAQTANTDYIIRTHAAEELFVQIAGEAEWMKGDELYCMRGPGDRMHHASFQPHASRTIDSALIAVWVWAGEVDYGTYSYVGTGPKTGE